MAGRRLCIVAVPGIFLIDVVAQRLAGDMKLGVYQNRLWISLPVIAALALGSYSLATGAVTLLTPDQQGHRFFERGELCHDVSRLARTIVVPLQSQQSRS